MAQNIISLGIDLDGFDDAKKAKVQGFIDLFDKLEKYDGKSFNPLSGGGLSDFNSALTETNLLLADISSKLNTVGAIKISPAAIKNISDGAKNATKDISVMNNEIQSSSGSFESVGRSATHYLGIIRKIAYILPGIGVAGIFNLAFEAIEHVVEGLFDVNSGLEKQNKLGIEANKIIEERIAILDDLQSKEEQYYEESRNNTNTLIDGQKTSLEEEKKIQLEKERGISQDRILASQRKQLNDKLIESENDIGAPDTQGIMGQKPLSAKDRESLVAGAVENMKQVGAGLLDKMQDADSKLQTSQMKLEDLKHTNTLFGKDWFDKIATQETTVEKNKSDYDLTKKKYEDNEKLLKDYYDNKHNLDKKDQEIDRFNSDQSLNLFVETRKQNLDVVLKTNEQIKQSDLTSELEKLTASKKIYNANLGINDLNRIRVTGVTEKDSENYFGDKNHVNIHEESTPDDIAKAKNNQNDANIKSKEDYEKQILDITTAYYQKFIKAQKDINVSQLETQATGDQAIYEAQGHHLDKMLAAYDDYLKAKQKIDDQENGVQNQAGQNSPFSGGSQTTDEISANNANNTKNKLDIQAKASEESYNISKGFLQKELDDIKDDNKNKMDLYTQQEAEELNLLTSKLHEKLIRWVTYKRDIKAIEKSENRNQTRLEVNEDVDKVSNDENIITKTTGEANASDSRLATKASELQSDKDNGRNTLDSQREYDIELGQNKAYHEALKKQNDQYNVDLTDLANKELKDAKARLEDFGKFALANIDKLINAYKKSVDAKYELQQEEIARNKASVDEQYQYEEDAINKSELSSVDKNALDIQLAEQKKEFDKQSELDTRKSKHDEAEADKQIAMFEIAINAAQAAVAALAKGGPLATFQAEEAVAFGIAQEAIVSSTPIPYEHGTPIGGTPYSGMFRTGEKGKPELIVEPYKSPYLVMRDNISYLPKGTDVIPLIDSPVFDNKISDHSWEQTKWLAKQLKKNNREIKNIIRPVINVDLGRELYKRKILGN